MLNKKPVPFLLIVLLLLGSVAGMCGGTMPLTANEMSLMLRSGYSSEAVLRDLSTRRFADTFDAAIEKQLTQAGANAVLIETLRRGTFQLSPSEIAAVKEKLTTQQAKASEASGTFAAATPEKHSPLPSKAPVDAIYRQLRDDLVYYHHGTIVHFDGETLENKKLYLFLFSSNGSKPGRQFTAKLIDFYNRVAPQHPELEVIFFSADRTQFGMETCMIQSNMPWPAVAYDKVAIKSGMIPQGVVRDIPCLVLADTTGRIVSHSGSGKDDSSVEQVLADLDRILANGAKPLAQK